MELQGSRMQATSMPLLLDMEQTQTKMCLHNKKLQVSANSSGGMRKYILHYDSKYWFSLAGHEKIS